ncbi:hypothetical protein E4U42_007144 [Claviceps africana]|uniref:Alginate lyase 2 domain-containing protein n=1 Tax=Claviceps africana TaxID=83212 RepID=A0A8K0J2C3_9HYPO|nr:hypothetical protein E4U42_007144 [Claviceps africana]
MAMAMATNTMIGMLVLVLTLLGSALGFAVPPVEGTEWIEKHPSPAFSVEQCAGGQVSDNNFYLPEQPNLDHGGDGCSNRHLRAERRYRNDYSSGVYQFGAAFRINHISDTRIAIRQIFNQRLDRPYFVLWAAKWGELFGATGDQLLASHTANVGRTVRLNTVHDVEEGRISLYIDGKELWRDNKVPQDVYYDKIGAYITDKSFGRMNITWTYVQFWQK